MNLIAIKETLHGELPFFGLPCLLVRLGECNLHCKYCDTDCQTKYTKTVDEVVKVISDSGLNNILITGGEPLLQRSDVGLIFSKLDLRKSFVIETNGSILIDFDRIVQPNLTFVMDVKLTSEADSFTFLNLKQLTSKDVMKFVFWDLPSFQKALDFFQAYKAELCWGVSVVFSPTMDVIMTTKMKDLTDQVIEMQKKVIGLNLYFQVQLHKILKIV